MGSAYNFVCSDCDYTAEVSGGADGGFMIRTETMVCRACREVVDVVVGTNAPEMVSADGMNRCPGCEGEDLAPWTESRPCPRCRGTMRADPAAPTIHWD